MDPSKFKVGDKVRYSGHVFTIYHTDGRGAYGHSKTAEKAGMGHSGSSSRVKTPSENGVGCWNFWFLEYWGVEKVNTFKGNI